jgi:hypothetical protein
MDRDFFVELKTQHGAAAEMFHISQLLKLFLGQSHLVTASSYTIVDADNGKTLVFNSATAQAVTVDPTLVAGFRCRVLRSGAGRVLLAASGTGSLVATPSGNLKQNAISELEITANTDGLSAVARLGHNLEPTTMSPRRVQILHGRNADGSVIVAASQGAGNFLMSLTPGTSSSILGEAAQSNTKTDTAVFDTTLPDDYVAGQDITATLNALLSGTGVAGTKTAALSAYKVASDGTHGANLIATAAQNLTGAAADYAFTITGASLSPGDRLILKAVTVVQETGGAATIKSQVNSIRLT